MSGLFGVPVDAAYHVVFALAHLLTPVAGGLAAAAAIILFTVAVRLLIWPLSQRALRGQAAMARIAPQVRALSARYGRQQPERFQRELAALYKREGASPFGGIAPLLAQWPFLTVTYLLFRSATVHGAPNKLLTDGLFGVPLGTHWLSGGLLSASGALFVAVFAVLAGLCWLSARLAKRAASSAAPAPALRAAASARQEPAEAPTNRAAGLLTGLIPYLTVVFAAFTPLATALYLLTTVAASIAERTVFQRRHHARQGTETGNKNQAELRASAQRRTTGLPERQEACRRGRGATGEA
jgi:YidC/Oxa1 family membrane protein insertase